MASILKVDKIVDSGSNVLATSSGSGHTIDSGVTFPAGGTGNAISIAILWDQKTGQTYAGPASSGWQDRTLNTELDPDGIVTLSSNEFTLGAGTYHIFWRVPGFFVGRHQSALCLANDTVVMFGASAYADTASGYENYETNWTDGETIVTPTTSTAYIIRHYCGASQGTNGLGQHSPHSSIDSIYTTVRITKLK